jgi:hypothetical protein
MAFLTCALALAFRVSGMVLEGCLLEEGWRKGDDPGRDKKGKIGRFQAFWDSSG